jgi:S-adenosylmethionine:diacylglycerol 3-amino-3-carboxypropyl transferase
VVRARLERAWRNHSNNSNPYAWRFLLGEAQPVLEQPVGPIRFVCEDAATYLESCKPASFDAFSLSNIADGAPSCYVRRLRSALDRAAKPGAVVVTRSFAEPNTAFDKNLAARDRSMIWGTVHVTGADNLCSTF